MKILIFIEGGMSFATYEEYLSWLKTDYTKWCTTQWIPLSKKKWKHHLAQGWIEQGGIVYIPEMPCDLDAKYQEWKIVFESVLSTVGREDGITFVGHSLGGNFLLKYFGEQVNDTSFFVISSEAEKSASKENTETDVSSLDMTKIQLPKIEQIHLVAACVSEGDFTEPDNYELLQSLGDRVHIWHAEEDSVVPFATAKFLEKTLPVAQTHFFSEERGYGHFYPLAVFPELEETLI